MTQDAYARFILGTEYELYRHLGAHAQTREGIAGVHFSVWAPNAKQVFLVGDFNHWDLSAHPMRLMRPYGIWELFIPGIGHGELYKFCIKDQLDELLFRSDPCANWFEMRPRNASVVYISQYRWEDHNWMQERPLKNVKSMPMNIYELHLGSWKRSSSGFPSYRQIAHELIPYVRQMGYTHIELMPIMEHPLDDSWGYQVTGYFAPTSRFGHPDDLRYFVDLCHREGIGVILDWVASHFPKDRDHLAFYDGTALYEHLDPRQGYQPQWDTHLFNYGRYEVQSFLISSALYWCREFHMDGLRVDAVTSMLYLNFGKEDGEWIANRDGSHENHEAIGWLQKLNSVLHAEEKGVVTIAEESTAFPGVTRRVEEGGLGFDLKWMMHDTLAYFKREPVGRRWHQRDLTFNMIYFYDEAFVLPLSHDEVVHLKKSIFSKMIGDDAQKAKHLLLLYSYAICFPGKKLFFMGMEIGQKTEWDVHGEVSWFLLDLPLHRHIHAEFQMLNKLYLEHSALWQYDYEPRGFRWFHLADHDRSVISYLRFSDEEALLCIHHFGDREHPNYLIPLPETPFSYTRATPLYAPEGAEGAFAGEAFHLHLTPLTTYIYKLL